jgi:hypothetical protein
MALSKRTKELRYLLQELLVKGQHINPRSQRQVWPLVDQYTGKVLALFDDEDDQK